MARGSDIGNPAGYMGDYARRGLSARQALEEFRWPQGRSGPKGGSMGNEAFRSTYASVRDSIAEHPHVSSLPGGERPGEEHFSSWKAGRPGRYAYGVDVHVYEPDTKATIRTPWTITSDFPLTIDEATQLALDEVEEGIIDGSGTAGSRATGATIRGLYRTV